MKLTLTVTGAQAAALGESARIVFTSCGGTIGRDESCDWVLPHPLVSRLHAIVRYADEVFTIEDRSTNGTRRVADATRLASGVPEAIHDGDVLVIGPYTITVTVEAEVVEGEITILADEPTGSRPRTSGGPASFDLNTRFETFTPRRTMHLDFEGGASDGGGDSTAAAPPEPVAPAVADQAPSPGAPLDDQGQEVEREFREDLSSPTRALPRLRLKGDRDRYTVWFGTNRRVDTAGDRIAFTAERDNQVHYGWCHVNIPESHKIGSVGSAWWKRLITRTDDRLTISRTELLDADSFWQQIGDGLASTPIDDRDAVVFVHGFNVSFEEASLRAAQLGFDLGINGLMAFYSWPSQGTLKGYPSDEATIEASEGYIADFLTDMATRSGAARVHVIAHSMGNRALLRAIDRIAATAAARAETPFDQIILAAPDVDQDIFKRLSVAYQRVARRTTLYVCAKDRAVEASHWIHSYARAGLVPPVTIVPGIDTINVSNLDLTLLGHGYVAEARELLTDIHELLRHGTPPDQRFGLRAATSAEGVYWLVGG